MKKFKLTVIMTIFVLMLAACSNSNNEADKSETKEKANDSTEPTTVEITDANGTVTVPVNPKKVVALDNRTFETLADWGIELAAAPKGLLPADSPYADDEEIEDVGMHFEPNLEAIAGVNPELVIVGQRFSGYYEDIKKLVPNTPVINLNIDVSEEADTPGENLVEGLKDTTVTLGKIFDKNEEAEKLTAEFDQAIEKAKSAYNEKDKVMGVIVSGGDIGFSAPKTGRVWGPMYEIFGWTPALEVEDTTSDHQGDEISVEAIAESNPNWIFALDRDAPLAGVEDKVPAQDVIDKSPALQKTTAVSKEQIVYAPEDTYLNESIQTYSELFNNLAKNLAK